MCVFAVMCSVSTSLPLCTAAAMFTRTIVQAVRTLSSAPAAEADPIKKLFLEKLKAYQKAKPKNDDIKRTVAELKALLK